MMQAAIGYAVLVLVLIGSAIGAVEFSGKEKGLSKLLYFLFAFVALVIICYVALGLVGGFFWVLSWIGILIRECLMWLVEAVLYPLRTLLP